MKMSCTIPAQDSLLCYCEDELDVVKLEDNAPGGVSSDPGQLRISDPAIKKQLISNSGFRAGAKTDSDKGFETRWVCGVLAAAASSPG